MLRRSRLRLGVERQDGLLQIRSRHASRVGRRGGRASRTAGGGRLGAAEEIQSKQRVSRALGFGGSLRWRLLLFRRSSGCRFGRAGAHGRRDVITKQIDGRLLALGRGGLARGGHSLGGRALKFRLLLDDRKGHIIVADIQRRRVGHWAVHHPSL